MASEPISRFMWWSTTHKTLLTGPSHPASAKTIRTLEKQPEWAEGGMLRSVVTNVPKSLLDGPESCYSGTYNVPATELLQAYYFILFSRAFPGFRKMSILEFGGGYGSFCRICKGMGHSANYVIHDLPEVSEIQKYVLAGVDVREWWHHPYMPDYREFDCLVAICSLSETDIGPDKGWVGRAPWMLGHAGHSFIVYQPKFGSIDNREFFSRFSGVAGTVVTGHELHISGASNDAKRIGAGFVHL